MDGDLHIIVQFLEALLIFILKLLGSIAILVIGWFASRYTYSFVKRMLARIKKLDPTYAALLSRSSQWLVMAVAVLTVLSQFGVQTASIVAVLGAAGLTIGLALQGALSNVAAGVILIALRLFRVGDVVEIGGVTGTVQELRLFTTELMRTDGVMVHLPNSTVWGTKITNFSQAKRRRTEITVPIAPDSDVRHAVQVISELFQKDLRILANPIPVVNIGDVAESHIMLSVLFWTEPRDLRISGDAMKHLILKRLPEAGVVLAGNHPVHIRTVTTPDDVA